MKSQSVQLEMRLREEGSGNVRLESAACLEFGDFLLVGLELGAEISEFCARMLS